MLLRFDGFAHDRTYRGPSGSWSAGDAREVDEPEASRLLSDFPSAFVRVEPPEPVAAVLPEPPADRAMPAPSRAKRGR